ncbi:MAG TPA: alpha/beta hydrolase [Bryobacteraceae bacterium]
MTIPGTNLATIIRTVLPLAAPILLCAAQPTTAELRQNIEYARPEGVGLALDAFVPAGDGPFPAVIIVHGGGFTGGDRRHAVAPLREALSDGDFVWFSIDYRLAPAHKPGDASDDLDAAAGFIRRHARRFKVDPSRIALVGESAGGYLVLMAASRPGGNQIKAVAAVGAPAQLWTLAPEIVTHVETALDIKGEAALRTASPISHIGNSMPPVLLLHGSDDSHVPLVQAEALCQAMQARRQSCELHVIQGGGHSANEWAAMPASGGFPPVLRDWLVRRLAFATASR